MAGRRWQWPARSPAEGTPVLLAAAATEDDDPAGVQLLLKHKARADARDRQRRSALHEAALAGHVEIIGVLLGAGANLEARDALGPGPGRRGRRRPQRGAAGGDGRGCLAAADQAPG
ncbi:hypothetical protein G6F23_014676 [Rhizopus arrhizus]|nr:hypothetical protein G6F23_014676 [Rhizopus arrhizus]